jgi:hypothetical protein
VLRIDLFINLYTIQVYFIFLYIHMRKILIVTLFGLVLAGCMAKNPTTTTQTGEIDTGVNQTGSRDEDMDAKDPVVPAETQPVVTATQSVTPTSPKPATTQPTATQSTKTEDEIVKDFEKEIDTLLNSIDTDGKKK